MVSFLARFKMSKAVKVYNVSYSKKFPKPSIWHWQTAKLLAHYTRNKLFLMVFWPCIIVQTWIFTNLMHNFMYSIIILHRDPQHVSSIPVLVFRRTIVYLQYLVSSHSVCCHSVWEDTRYCKYTIVLLKMSTGILETCWGSWCNIIIEYIKLCIKLVKIQVRHKLSVPVSCYTDSLQFPSIIN
jgi:hypothetical protein